MNIALLRWILLYEIAEQTGHEACADILEGARRAVVELEAVDRLVDLDERDVELEGVINDVLEVVGRDVLTEEALGNLEGDLLQGHVLDIVEERLWEWVDTLWHIETLVRSQTFDDSLGEGYLGGDAVGAVVFHCNL